MTTPSLYLVIETFKDGDPVPVYRRFRERGRMLPDGLVYISSWVDRDLGRCYQLMQTADSTLFDPWISSWSDLADFEVRPVVTSGEAADRVASHDHEAPAALAKPGRTRGRRK